VDNLEHHRVAFAETGILRASSFKFKALRAERYSPENPRLAKTPGSTTRITRQQSERILVPPLTPNRLPMPGTALSNVGNKLNR